MGIAKKLYYKAIQLIPTTLLQRIAKLNVLLPYHHLVSDEKLAHIHHLYPYKNKSHFTADLEFLLKHFNPVTPEQIHSSFNGGKTLPKNPFLLTFDDGLREVYDVVCPILKQMGVPAVFFLNSAFIDNKDLFYRYECSLLIDALKNGKVSNTQETEAKKLFEANGFEGGDTLQYIKKLRYAQKHLAKEVAAIFGVSFADFLSKQKPYLTTEQVKELHQQGFYFGSHSIDHPFYDKLPLEEQIKQTIEPYAYLHKTLPIKENYFAFPHTDKGVNKVFFDEVFNYSQYPQHLIFGTNNQKQDIDKRILQRFNCENPELSIKQSVNGILAYHIIHKLLGKNKVARN